jgi:hypothetical protein
MMMMMAMMVMMVTMMMMITQHRFDGARTILILQQLLCLKYLQNARKLVPTHSVLLLQPLHDAHIRCARPAHLLVAARDEHACRRIAYRSRRAARRPPTTEAAAAAAAAADDLELILKSTLHASSS